MPRLGLNALAALLLPLAYLATHVHTLFTTLGVYRHLAPLLPSSLLFVATLAGLHPSQQQQQHSSLISSTSGQLRNVHGLRHFHIPNTSECEDLHHHVASSTLFTACQSGADGGVTQGSRAGWFPPLGHFDNPQEAWRGAGGLYTINVDTTVLDKVSDAAAAAAGGEGFKAQKLKLEGWDENVPFVTHGIDVIDDEQSAGKAVWIWAVNHLPNPEYFDGPSGSASGVNSQGEKAASQLEIFHHTLGSKTAKYVRSIAHPLVKTPNDLLILPKFNGVLAGLVTNDHHYREGGMRAVEEMGGRKFAGWSTTVRVEVNLEAPVSQEERHNQPGGEKEKWEAVRRAIRKARQGVEAEVVITGLHNNNGLGHGPPSDPSSFFVVDASGGRVYHAKQQAGGVKLGDGATEHKRKSSIKIIDEAQLPNTLDNPSWFVDPYAHLDAGRDHTGLVLPGLTTASSSIGNITGSMPSNVWLMSPPMTGGHLAKMSHWRKRLLFADDGGLTRSASGAVIVAQPGSRQGTKKERLAWLFVTGFVSESILAVQVDLAA